MAEKDKDTTGVAQGRFTIALPKEMGEQIDAVGARLSKVLAEQTGVAFELTRAQIVQALIRQALPPEEVAAA